MTADGSRPHVMLPWLGAVLLLVCLAGLPWLLLTVSFAMTVPNALEPAADPCCTPPATWGDVAIATVVATLSSGVLAATAAVGVRLVGRRPARAGRRGRGPLLAAVAVLASILCVLAVRAPDARPLDCDRLTATEQREAERLAAIDAGAATQVCVER